MDRNLLIAVGIGLIGYAIARNSAAIDTTILDARDAQAAAGSDAPADASGTWSDAADPNYGDWGAAAVTDGTAETGSGYYGGGIEDINYDLLGNPISSVAFQWGDGAVWSESKIPAQYLALIRAQEAQYRMPKNMLARLLFQESRYNPQVISGAVRSPRGAAGIAQFMPENISGVPEAVALDPFQAIPAAAAMLARLYKRFSSWSAALASYNWGEGNVAAWLRTGKGVKGDVMPLETQKYYSQILADVGTGSGVTIA